VYWGDICKAIYKSQDSTDKCDDKAAYTTLYTATDLDALTSSRHVNDLREWVIKLNLFEAAQKPKAERFNKTTDQQIIDDTTKACESKTESSHASYCTGVNVWKIKNQIVLDT